MEATAEVDAHAPASEGHACRLHRAAHHQSLEVEDVLELRGGDLDTQNTGEGCGILEAVQILRRVHLQQAVEGHRPWRRQISPANEAFFGEKGQYPLRTERIHGDPRNTLGIPRVVDQGSGGSAEPTPDRVPQSLESWKRAFSHQVLWAVTGSKKSGTGPEPGVEVKGDILNGGMAVGHGNSGVRPRHFGSKSQMEVVDNREIPLGGHEQTAPRDVVPRSDDRVQKACILPLTDAPDICVGICNDGPGPGGEGQVPQPPATTHREDTETVRYLESHDLGWNIVFPIQLVMQEPYDPAPCAAPDPHLKIKIRTGIERVGQNLTSSTWMSGRPFCVIVSGVRKLNASPVARSMET